MENPNYPKPFVHFTLESVHESLRGCSPRIPLSEIGFWLPLRIETWLASGLLPRLWLWRFSAPLVMWLPLKVNLGLSSLWSSLPPTSRSIF